MNKFRNTVRKVDLKKLKDLDEESDEASQDLSSISEKKRDPFNNYDISKILGGKGDGLKMSQVEEYVQS